MGKIEMMPQYADFAVADGKLWYSSCLMNGLFSQSIVSGEIEFIGCFPEEDFDRDNLFRRVILVDRELIFIPYCARHISIYHIDHKCFTNFDVPDGETMGKYVSVVVVDRKLYLFPANAKKAIVFDAAKKEILELRRFNGILASLLNCTSQKFYLAGTTRLGDCIYLALRYTNQLIRYSIKEDDVSQFALDFDGENLGGITANRDYVYIGASGKKQMMRLNSNGQEKLYYQADDINEMDKITDFPILQCYDSILYLHFMGHNILHKLDLDTMKMEKIVLTGKTGSAYLMKLEGKELFFIPCQGYPMYRYSIEEGKVYQMTAMLPQVWNTMRRKAFRVFYREKKGMMIYENEINSLDNYLEVLSDLNNK